jgi:hypothetical protein
MAMNEQGIASLGRGGDDQFGHLTTGEKVLPLPVAQDPSVQRVINESFAKYDLDPNQYTVGHAANSINPNTQFAEFGFFKKLGKAFRKVAQIVGTVVGFVYGGPMGAAIGSSIGGGVRRGNFDLKNAVTDFAGGYALGSFGAGMGLQGATGRVAGSGVFGGQGISGLKAAFQPVSQGGMWGWQSTPAVATGTTGIGGFFQDLGAMGASALNAPSTYAPTHGGQMYATPTLTGAWGKLSGLEKLAVSGMGAAAMQKLAGDQTLGGPQGALGLDPQSEQYLTQPLRPAIIPTAGIPPEYQVSAYQGAGGVGGLSSPEQQLIEALEAQRRKYLMQYPEFPVGYNEGGSVNNDGVPIDNIPAMLTEDEHVLTRDAIEGLGGGDFEEGHRIAKQINDAGENQEDLLDEILERKYFMQFPKFNVGVG